MNITVYCGSHFGKDPAFYEATKELSKWIGENGHTLIYGAGNVGFMGVMADSVMEAGGKVTGITPGFFIDMGEIHDSLDELIVVKTISERRSMMLELGDAFIALPGGMGTLDEFTELCAYNRLQRFDTPTRTKPAILLNINGFFDDFLTQLRKMIEEGFYRQSEYDFIIVANSIEDIAAALK